MTNKEFETKCLAVVNGTASIEVRREVVAEAACLRGDYIDSISRDDIWDQEHCQVAYDPYIEEGEKHETADALIEWAKGPCGFLPLRDLPGVAK